jgi:hypothetical protein
MKTKSEIAAMLYTVLTALSEAKITGGINGGIPNGHLYAQLMGHIDIGAWNLLIESMASGNRKSGPLITQENYLLKITERGEFVLRELDTVYNSVKTQEAK